MNIIKKIIFLSLLLVSVYFAELAQDLIKASYSASNYLKSGLYLCLLFLCAYLILYFLAKLFNKTILDLLGVKGGPVTLKDAQSAVDDHDASVTVGKIIKEYKDL